MDNHINSEINSPLIETDNTPKLPNEEIKHKKKLLRTVLRIGISFLIWVSISFIAIYGYFKLSIDEIDCGGYINGIHWSKTCNTDNTYSDLAEIINNNIILASILSFIIIPAILIYLFNIYFFKKKLSKQRVQ